MVPNINKSIIKKYLSFVRLNSRFPNLSELRGSGVTLRDLKDSFGDIEILHQYMEDNYKEKISKHVLSQSQIFTTKHLEQLSEDVKKHKRFFITTAVNQKKIFTPFYNSIKSYCEKNDAKLLLIPCADVFSKFKKEHLWAFDPKLKDETFIFKETKINDNLFISSIKNSAKQINPRTGLGRIAQRHGSFVYASPKQDLEFVNRSSSFPQALMTPGAITMPSYGGDRYMSERISYIAENDHVFGGIIIEVQNNKTFHFRQVQAAKDGSFIDLKKKYHKNGKVSEVEADLVLGDWHSGETDPVVSKVTQQICDELGIRNLYVHDLFNGTSVCHHEDGNLVKLSRKAVYNELSIEKELKLVGSELNKLSSWVNGNVYIVKSNHDEWLDRYLEDSAFVDDPDNYYISCDLVRKQIEGKDPLKYGVNVYGDLKLDVTNRIIWFSRDYDGEGSKVSGVYLAAHGDIGINNSKGSLLSIEKGFGDCIVGHTHSGAIMRGVWRVGTSTAKQSYQRGPSNHTNTHCLIYPNGARQLINIIRGYWRI